MVVPFDAVTNFNDPSVGFGLQFGIIEHDEGDEIEEGNKEAVGKLMNKNHELLNKIGVGHSLLEKLVELTLDAGALGAKLTGGGGGGNMVALANNAEKQAEIFEKITEAGYRAYQTTFGED